MNKMVLDENGFSQVEGVIGLPHLSTASQARSSLLSLDIRCRITEASQRRADDLAQHAFIQMRARCMSSAFATAGMGLADCPSHQQTAEQQKQGDDG
jgi:hypothetical protein